MQDDRAGRNVRYVKDRSSLYAANFAGDDDAIKK